MRVAVGHSINPCINYADSADWFLLPEGDSLYLVPSDAVTLDEKRVLTPPDDCLASPSSRMANTSLPMVMRVQACSERP